MFKIGDFGLFFGIFGDFGEFNVLVLVIFEKSALHSERY